MEQNISEIRNWLGVGSINIFGLPFSGKDTVGIRLAENLGAKFLSSGIIMRAAAESDSELAKEMNAGLLATSQKFIDAVTPYLHRPELKNSALVLSSVGRWSGEELAIIDNCKSSGHPIKAVILLNISVSEAKNRWFAAKTLMDRGKRVDDKDALVLDQRINEFIAKTMPVIETYQKRGLLIPIQATGEREAVYQLIVEKLAEFARSHPND